MIFTSPESAHWYTQEGMPAYNSTLREARKLGLLPSITSVIAEQKNFGLENWKAEQLLMAALTLPRNDGESEHDWIKRIIEDSRAQSDTAKEIGIAVHHWIECHLKGLTIEIQHPALTAIWPAIEQWLDENVGVVLFCEESGVNLRYGYGGRIDLCFAGMDDQVYLVDFKTQKTKDGKIAKYFTWCSQLAAQHQLTMFDDLHVDKLINVVISTTETGLIKQVEWGLEDEIRGYKLFLALLDVFRLSRNFYYEVA